MNYSKIDSAKYGGLIWVQISALTSVDIIMQMPHLENQIHRSTKSGAPHVMNIWFLNINDVHVATIHSQEVESRWHEAVEVSVTSLRANLSEMDSDIHWAKKDVPFVVSLWMWILSDVLVVVQFLGQNLAPKTLLISA